MYALVHSGHPVNDCKGQLATTDWVTYVNGDMDYARGCAIALTETTGMPVRIYRLMEVAPYKAYDPNTTTARHEDSPIPLMSESDRLRLTNKGVDVDVEFD